MARQIIILEQLGLPSDLRYRACFWVPVPPARQQFYANPEFKSAVIGVTPAELSALQAGQGIEQIEEFSFPLGTPAGAIQSALVARFNELQSDLITYNKYNRYGWSYDGTSWSAPS